MSAATAFAIVLIAVGAGLIAVVKPPRKTHP
jgi:hypothetical protein